MNLYYLNIAILVPILLTALWDFMLRSTWAPAYYRFGIPLFKMKLSLSALPDLSFFPAHLEAALNQEPVWPQSLSSLQKKVFQAAHKERPIELQRLNSETIAYRRFEREQSERFHGRVRFNKTDYQAEVVGYFNWLSLMLPLLMIAFLFMMPLSFMPVFFLIFFLIVGRSVSDQRKNHRHVSQTIEALLQQPASQGWPGDQMISSQPASMPEKSWSDFITQPRKRTEPGLGLIFLLVILMILTAVAILVIFLAG